MSGIPHTYYGGSNAVRKYDGENDRWVYSRPSGQRSVRSILTPFSTQSYHNITTTAFYGSYRRDRRNDWSHGKRWTRLSRRIRAPHHHGSNSIASFTSPNTSCHTGFGLRAYVRNYHRSGSISY